MDLADSIRRARTLSVVLETAAVELAANTVRRLIALQVLHVKIRPRRRCLSPAGANIFAAAAVDPE
jgi:hypothetical protein